MIRALIRHQEVRRFSRFALVGLLNTAIDFTIFFSLLHLTNLSYLGANMISFLAAAINSYTLNRRWTFRSGARDIHREGAQYVTVIGVGFLLNEGLLYLLVDHGDLPTWAGKVVVTGVVLIWNFLANRFWTFRHHVGSRMTAPKRLADESDSVV